MYGPCEGPRQLAVSYDGTWKTRGFQSPIGIGFVIETLTGLVLDYAVLSRYCVECEMVVKKLSGEELESWKQLHADTCSINHTGSSGSMETEAAKVMWARSVELLNAEYTSLLGDGDAAVLSALNTLRPYGADVEIVKHECINHISKRMYRGLEKVVKDAKSAVGCGLGGKGKLTQVRMKKWTQYYRNAVVKHAPEVAKTRDAIWAIYQHSVSTEDDPQHDNCDVDWCWWQQAMAAGVDPEERRQEGRHDPPLPLPAAERLLPLFERLSKPDLLERCMSLGTSNANESLHSVIWRRASKAVFATRSTVEIAVAFGVVQFNCGGAGPAGRFQCSDYPAWVIEQPVGCCCSQHGQETTQAGFSYCKGRVEDCPQTQVACEAVCRGISHRGWGPPVQCRCVVALLLGLTQFIGLLKALYTSPPSKPVHSDTNSTSVWSILAMQQLRVRTIHSHFHHCL